MKNTNKLLALAILLSVSFFGSADELGSGRCITGICGFAANDQALTAPVTTTVDEGDDELGSGFVAECNWLEELFGLCSSGK